MADLPDLAALRAALVPLLGENGALLVWRGDRPDWTAASEERFRRMERLGERLGLL